MPALPAKIVKLAGLIAATILAGAAGYMLCADFPFFDALYMAVMTMTTIGYGEIRPLGQAGRVFNLAYMMLSVSVLLLTLGVITQSIVEAQFTGFFGRRRARKMIDSLKGHYIICGYGRVGRGAAAALRSAGKQVVVLDRREDRVDWAMKDGYIGLLGDSTRDETLREAGISRAEGLIAALATDADNLFAVISAKTLNPAARIGARAAEEEAERKMRQVGADSVFAPYTMTGARLAQSLLKPHVHQFLDFATTSPGLNVRIEQIQVSPNSELAGRTLEEMRFRSEMQVIVLAIRRAAGEMLFNPSAGARVERQDCLIVMGEPEPLRRLRFVAEDTLAWLAREMHPRDAPAAFSSAQDADSEGVEGKFYVWTADEFGAVLGEDADAAARLYGVVPQGNWEDGVNVLERRDPESVRASLALSAEDFARWERSVRDRLYEARARRVHPLTDDKVLADWNGMALRAFAEAGRLLARPDLVDTARALARFLLGVMTRDGRLCHAWRAGQLRTESYLADYAQVGLGLVELHAASGELQWLDAARQLAEGMVERFLDPDEGFYDGEPGALPLRARDPFDGAVPSATAAACELLLRLSGVYERGDWAELAQRSIDRYAGLIAHAEAAPALLHAQLLVERGAELALPVAPGAQNMIAAAQSAFAPLVTFAIGAPEALPVLAGRKGGEAYLCRRGACGLPARSIEDLTRQLDSLSSP